MRPATPSHTAGATINNRTLDVIEILGNSFPVQSTSSTND